MLSLPPVAARNFSMDFFAAETSLEAL